MRKEESRKHFEDCLKKGRDGELAVEDLLYSHCYYGEGFPCLDAEVLFDLSADADFQEKDIDFMVRTRNEHIFYIEVKTDFLAHKTGNFVYELTTSGNNGCFAKTKADYIIYHINETDENYIVDICKLRRYVSTSNLNLVPMGDSATGYLIPIKTLEEENIIHKITIIQAEEHT